MSSVWVVCYSIYAAKDGLAAVDRSRHEGEHGLMGRLDELDLTQRLSRKESDQRLEAAQERLATLRLQLGGQIGDGKLGPPVCVVFEGWDASGKGGAIKRLVDPLDPRHVRVVSFAAPTHDELRHHFLWRFWPSLPGWGGMAVFDRSWYGRVLVERVEGFALRRGLAARVRRDPRVRGHPRRRGHDHDQALDACLGRGAARAVRGARRATRLKTWKLTDEDWRNREKRPAYVDAVEEMIARTEHPARSVGPDRGRLEAVRQGQGRSRRSIARIEERLAEPALSQTSITPVEISTDARPLPRRQGPRRRLPRPA